MSTYAQINFDSQWVCVLSRNGQDLLLTRDPNKYLIWEPVWWSPAINLYDYTIISRLIQDMSCFETEQPLVIFILLDYLT